MTETMTSQPTVIKTSRGLTIAGTRTTLYSLMDYLHAGWPPHLIRDEFGLSEQQMTGVMAYIEAHRAEVETEYQEVVQQAEENRRYWEERNRERLAKIADTPPKPGQEQIRAKLQAAKVRLGIV
ncbi:MAG: DUF433 domain-containing protein [Deltaproteobacteria bacterium]|nr:DUF433 domain-containing protein [Deltaproteobacteria bacterium]